MKFFLTLVVAFIVSTAAIGPDGHRSIETMISMRDGINLHTLIHLPKEKEDGEKFTAVVDRSPYGYGDMEWV
jgi:predicted acyl esterase